MGADVAIAEKAVKLRETERTDLKVRLEKSAVPWLPEEYFETHLVRMRVGSSQFLFGSAIRGRALVDAANQLDTHRSQICNNLINTHLPSHTDSFNPHVRRVKNSRAIFPTFEIGNPGGQRVFFMRLADSFDRLPVIVKIAVCDKARENQVLATITTDSKKSIKKSARL